MTSEQLLCVRDLSVSAYGNPILTDVDLCVNRAKTHVVMGPNGAGKSTLGHAIMGDPTYTIESGSILFDGEEMSTLPPDKRSHRGVFMSFQAPVEIPGVPVSSFLRASAAGRAGADMKGKRFRNHLKELATTLDMDLSYLDRELGVGFSGGEKKKLEMLQLLLLKPKLAILDETDSGLDVDALGVVSKGISTYRETTGGALVIITHNTRILKNLQVDHVHVMVRGRLVATGDASLIDIIDSQGFEQFEHQVPVALEAE